MPTDVQKKFAVGASLAQALTIPPLRGACSSPQEIHAPHAHPQHPALGNFNVGIDIHTSPSEVPHTMPCPSAHAHAMKPERSRPSCLYWREAGSIPGGESPAMA